MELDAQSNWLIGARHVESPNCDERPPNCDIDLMVVHGISLPPDQYGGPYIDALFTNRLDPRAHEYFRSICGLKVSSHVLIRRDGEVIQYVPFAMRAWHAGVSQHCGRSACNDYSLGVELEGSDHVAYEDIQYRKLARLARLVMQSWPGITRERIVGHSDIAPGRKTDPGPAFDWSRLYALLDD